MQLDRKMLRRLALIVGAILILAASVMASSIGTFTPQNQIDIISQTGIIDTNLTYTFREVNKTYWIANFCAKPTLTSFNSTDYPLTSLSAGITFEQLSPIRFNAVSKCGWFYIIFPDGFKPDLKAKFGTNSTLIATSTTTPFVTNQRAICRDGNNNIHVAYLYNSTWLEYANSTDNGVTFTNITLNSSTNIKGTPYITCSGNTLIIVHTAQTINATSLYKSNDNGASWSYQQLRTGLVRPQGAGGMVGIELIGARAYIVYQRMIIPSYAYDSVVFFNSTDTATTWGNDVNVFLGSHTSGKLGCTETYFMQGMGVNGSGGANDNIFIMATYSFTGLGCGDGGLNMMKNSSTSGVTWSGYYETATTITKPSLTARGNSVYYTTEWSPSGGIYDVTAYNQTTTFDYNTFTSTKINYDLNSTWYNNSRYPVVGINNTGAILIYSQKELRDNGAYENNYKLMAVNFSNGWGTRYNLTTNATNNIYPNMKMTDTGGCQEYVYQNGTASPYGIVYGAIGTCTAPTPPAQGGGTPPVMDIGDPLYCSIPSFIPSAQSVPVFCMPKSNTTGQPLTGLTVTCGAYSSPIFAATSQAASSATEQGNGLYNWTFLAANQAANTCYIINCSTTINTVTNSFAGTVCVMRNDLATSTDVANIIGNITAVQTNILGNLSGNFTATNALVNLALGNQTLILGNQSVIITNIATLSTNMGNNFTLILGNESTIITNIATLSTNMGANFTYTNGQIALILGNQTYILGNESIIITNLANVNSTQNANALLILNNQTLILGNETTIITNIATLQSLMGANFTAITTLLNQLGINITSVNTTQNSNYATLQLEIQNTNTTQNGNYAALTTLLNQVGINITSVNTTQNTNANNIITLLNALGVNITSVNTTMMGNFSTLYTLTVSLNNTINAGFGNITVDLTQMNGTLNTMSSNLGAMNTTIVNTQGTVNNTYTLLQAIAINDTEHNATLTAYYNSLLASLQDMNTTLNGVDANVTLTNSSINYMLSLIAYNQTQMNASMIANFLITYADLQQMNVTLNNINSTVSGIGSNVTAAQIALAVWAFNHRTLTPLNTTVLTITSTPGWQLPKGYAPTMSCSSNQNESNFTLYFAGTAVPNPYTYAPSQGTYEVRCESPQSENYSAGVSVAYLVITMGGTGGSAGNVTNANGSISPLISATTEQTAPTGWIEYIFIVIPTAAYRILQITLFGLGLWAYFLAGLVVIFLLSIASKREIKSLTDVPFYGMVAFIFAIVIFVVYILVPLAVR